ncbi:hypothetical protein, partial [Neisseria blantyrii]|uniref:hypothetical protein n=1 Tax=Neisseria blantyrii TaxID=2830647 RepID=UPI002729E889
MLFVIPAQASSFPRRRESSFFEFQLFLINSCSFEFLDSRFRGKDAERLLFVIPAFVNPLYFRRFFTFPTKPVNKKQHNANKNNNQLCKNPPPP